MGEERGPENVVRLAPALGGFNLNELERLVAEHGAEVPERADEWASYLFFLREHAALDGALPHSFDSLIEEVFGELL